MTIMRKKDKRAFVRLYAYHLAKYKPFSGKEAKVMPVTSNLKDISAGGVCLRTEASLSIGEILELIINFPPFEEPIYCKSKVMWVKKSGRAKRYEIGLEFIDLDKGKRKAIDEGIKFVQRKVNAS